MNLYKVGGAVRDVIMGRKPKDVDFTVELTEAEVDEAKNREMGPFAYTVNRLQEMGFKVFKEDPDFYTIRAKGPKGFTFAGEELDGGFDFVLARKDGPSADGRRPDWVGAGTLADDLARRDFTMNAMAQDSEGRLLDPFDGSRAIADRNIMTVGDPATRFNEDRLRILRAIRFGITLEFTIDELVYDAIVDMVYDDPQNLFAGVSRERIREELEKMFRANTPAAMEVLQHLKLIPILFAPQDIWLLPTARR